MKNVFRLFFFTIVPILAGVGVIAYFVVNKEPPKQAPVVERAVHVRVVNIAPTSVTPTVTGYGVVQPAKTWNGISQVGGKVIYVHPDFQKGSSMASGTEVIRLSPADYNLAIAQAEANIRSAAARLQELLVTEENTKQSLKIEEDTLILKNNELQRKQTLLKSGSGTRVSVEIAQTAALSQRQKVQGMKNTLTLVPTQRSVLKEQIAVYQTSLSTAKLNLERTSIKLPFAARVSEVNTEISQYLVPGQSIGQFDGVENAEIDTQLPIQLFGHMVSASGDPESVITAAPGALSKVLKRFRLKARVRLNLGKNSVIWQGTVSRISDTIDPKTRTVGVIVTVPNAYRKLKPGIRPPLAKGMFVEVAISNRSIKNALIVPRSALHGNTIYIANGDDRLELRPVEVNFIQDDIAIISEGLNASDRVVVSALNPAIPGQLLKLTVDTDLEQSLKNQPTGDGEAQ